MVALVVFSGSAISSGVAVLAAAWTKRGVTAAIEARMDAQGQSIEEIKTEQKSQWSKINESLRKTDKLESNMKCPLPNCPMHLTPKQARG
jgi:hypothetical protein